VSSCFTHLLPELCNFYRSHTWYGDLNARFVHPDLPESSGFLSRMRRRDQFLTLVTIAWTGVVLWWTSTLNLGMDAPTASALEITPAPTEEKLVQKLPPPKIRFTVEQEIEMACLEADCVRKCVASFPDRGAKFDACRKVCGKERCKNRCKNEPNLSYVERELKREKCLDKCKPTDEKCKKFCDEESRKCKDRCKERAHRYFCVRDLDKLGQDDEEETAVDPSMFTDEAGLI